MDAEVVGFLKYKQLNLTATTNFTEEIEGASYVLIATSTDHDPEANHFNIQSIETVITKVNSINPDCAIIIKSTIRRMQAI